MASSRKSQRSKRASTSLESLVAGHLRECVAPGGRVLLGLSGGVDSMVLLDLLARIANRRRIMLAALHVNHQISPNSGRWAAFCRAACRAHGIPLRVVRVNVQGGNSLEAAARAARYGALFSQKTDCIVLAHNQDDQAETLLLQLLRGAGVKGLAAMPLVSGKRLTASGGQNVPQALGRKLFNTPLWGALDGCSRAKPRILRPLLEIPRNKIVAYAARRKLAWIEDESNADIYYLRNYLRHEVLPLIAQRFPAYRTTLARSAGHFADASKLLDELAAHDGADYLRDGALPVAGLRKLSSARARNLLRYYLACHGVIMPNAERLEEALRQSLTAKNDAGMRIDLGAFELRRYAGALFVVAKTALSVVPFASAWRGAKRLELPQLNGVLTMTKCCGAGIGLAKLKSEPVTVQMRSGGEKLQPDCRRPRRTLKNLLQEAGVPPWRRDSLPLLFCGNQLVWVPGIGVDCEFQALADETSVVPTWSAQ